MSFRVPEKFRVRTGPFASGPCDLFGAFFVPVRTSRAPLKVIACDGNVETPELAGWEHVSVSLPDRCPTWAEMAHVKSLFWSEDDCVVQFHPPRSEYVNNHPYCLHLWRCVGAPLPMPPSILVGIKSLGELESPETVR